METENKNISSGQKRTLSKKIKSLMILVVVFGVVSLASFIGYPQMVAMALEAPSVEPHVELTNQNIILKAATGNIVVQTEKGELIWPEKNADGSFRPEIDLGKRTGKQTYKIFNFQDLGFRRILSNTYITKTITGDYEAPIITNLDIKDTYTEAKGNISFTISEPAITIRRNDNVVYTSSSTDNMCTLDPEDSKTITCPFEFDDKRELTLTYVATDQVGNSTTFIDQKTIKQIDRPTLNCTSPTQITNKDRVTITCQTNKTGVIKIFERIWPIYDTRNSIELEIPLDKEGQNRIQIGYVDTDGEAVGQELTITRDSREALLDFTFLDTKKELQTGDIKIAFRPNEKVDVIVNFTTQNSKFDDTPPKQQAAQTGVSIKGGQVFTQTIESGVESIFTVKNDFATCESLPPSPVYPKGYESCYISGPVYTNIKLTDRAGNTSLYQCMTFVNSPIAPIVGFDKTQCSKK